jgi:large subunit ribosomal protein L6
MLKNEIELPEGIEARVENDMITVKGKNGETSKMLKHPLVSLKIDGRKIIIASDTEKKKVRAVIGTWVVVIGNMLTGVTKGWRGELKLVYSHFPVKMKIEKDRFLIENFLGERSARSVQVPGGVKVQIDKSEVYVSGVDKETVGQTCASIEQATRIKGFDKRVFQDGIYITRKPYPEAENEK